MNARSYECHLPVQSLEMIGYRTTIRYDTCGTMEMKTVKQDESISRSRFIDCPVCKNHTLKLKRTVQVGRCKSCSETYKIIIVYVKDGKKAKTQNVASITTGAEKKTEAAPESSLPALQSPSDSALFGSSSEPYPGLSEALFGSRPDEKTGEAGSGSSQ